MNTLKYANRAGKIKRTVSRNVVEVSMHVSEYKAMIANLKSEIEHLRSLLTRQPAPDLPPSLNDELKKTQSERARLEQEL
jgi:hypothetical protein